MKPPRIFQSMSGWLFYVSYDADGRERTDRVTIDMLLDLFGAVDNRIIKSFPAFASVYGQDAAFLFGFYFWPCKLDVKHLEDLFYARRGATQ